MGIKITIGNGDSVSEDAKDADFVIIEFGRQTVVDGLTGDALDRLMSLSDDRDLTVKLKGNVSFVFDGWGNDPREIHEIQECRRFFAELTNKWPYWFHFLEKEQYSVSIAVLMLCSSEVVRREGNQAGSQIGNADELKRVMLRLFDGMNVLYEAHGFDEKQNIEVTDQVLVAISRRFA